MTLSASRSSQTPSHHERFDGSGYLNKVARDAIPLAARIVAVADVYNALTSKRVYNEAFSHAQTIEGHGRRKAA